MEQWNIGILGPLVFHLVKKSYGSGDKQIMDRKNINRGFRIPEISKYLAWFLRRISFLLY
jgi:hypothetical protein